MLSSRSCLPESRRSRLASSPLARDSRCVSGFLARRQDDGRRRGVPSAVNPLEPSTAIAKVRQGRVRVIKNGRAFAIAITAADPAAAPATRQRNGDGDGMAPSPAGVAASLDALHAATVGAASPAASAAASALHRAHPQTKPSLSLRCARRRCTSHPSVSIASGPSATRMRTPSVRAESNHRRQEGLSALACGSREGAWGARKAAHQHADEARLGSSGFAAGLSVCCRAHN